MVQPAVDVSAFDPVALQPIYCPVRLVIPSQYVVFGSSSIPRVDSNVTLAIPPLSGIVGIVSKVAITDPGLTPSSA